MRRQEAPSEMEFLRLLRLLKLLRLHRLLRVMEKIHRNFPKIEYVVTACELLTCMMLMAHWMVHTFSKVFSSVPSYIKYTRTLSFKSACEACAFFQVSYASDEGWVAVRASCLPPVPASCVCLICLRVCLLRACVCLLHALPPACVLLLIMPLPPVSCLLTRLDETRSSLLPLVETRSSHTFYT
jgi:hypothetical protein